MKRRLKNLVHRARSPRDDVGDGRGHDDSGFTPGQLLGVTPADDEGTPRPRPSQTQETEPIPASGHVPQTPAVEVPQPEGVPSLWIRAYETLHEENEELVNRYEEILSKELRGNGKYWLTRPIDLSHGLTSAVR
jgi:hypothetical protein